MRIGIIGTGNIGEVVGALWARAGHEILFGSRRAPKLDALLARVGGGARAGSVAEAADFGAVVFCAFPYGVWPEVAPEIAPVTAGKIVVDAANPYPERDGAFAQEALDRGDGSAAPVAALLPKAHLVRAFSTVYYETLRTQAHREGERVGIPLASDDVKAIESVGRLIRDAGFEPVNVGDLTRAALFDVGTAVYNTGATASDVAATLFPDAK